MNTRVKTFMPLVGAVLAVALCGCQSPRTASALATSIATTVALQEKPEIRPYIQIAAEVICTAANDNATTPDSLFERLAQIPNSNPYANLFLNVALTGYISYWERNDKDAKEVLLGNCDGLRFGLLSATPQAIRAARGHYPRLKVK